MTEPRHEDDELLDALGVDLTEESAKKYTAREELIIAGFGDIVKFYETHGRVPGNDEKCDIFERLYAVRLDRLRNQPDARELLAGMDIHGLLGEMADNMNVKFETLNDDELLAELGESVDNEGGEADVTVLRHVRSPDDRRAAEEIAQRIPCRDFSQFKPLLDQAEAELAEGLRKTIPFGRDTGIERGQFFILGGQIAYVAEKGEAIELSKGKKDARLRVIYANGTESDLLLRSLQRALYKDEFGRRLTEPVIGPLFGEEWEEGDMKSGIIYVLRSQSMHPYVAEHRELIHKIGVTHDKVETRIANAERESTYLLANVNIVATYKLSKINRSKLENLLHRIFASAKIDISIQDRFGNPVQPREWYLVPLEAIDEAVQRICDGSITDFAYDPNKACLIRRG